MKSLHRCRFERLEQSEAQSHFRPATGACFPKEFGPLKDVYGSEITVLPQIGRRSLQCSRDFAGAFSNGAALSVLDDIEEVDVTVRPLLQTSSRMLLFTLNRKEIVSVRAGAVIGDRVGQAA